MPKLPSGMFSFINFSLPFSPSVCNVFFCCYVSYFFYRKGKVYRKSSSTVQVGLSGTEQSTVNVEHLLTSNSASASLLIDADHRLNEA
jgi:hypothetical protein